MRIGFDARFITNLPRRGIGNYSISIISELVKTYPEIEFFLYISSPDAEAILPLSNNVTIRKLSMPLYPLWEQIALPFASYRDSLDILHCLGNTAPLFLFKKIKLVVSLHDVIFLNRRKKTFFINNYYQKYGEIYKSSIVKILAKKADSIITVSEYSKKDISQSIPLLKFNIEVIYQSCNNIFSIQQKLSNLQILNFLNKRPFILALGADDPRKNTLRLIEAYLKLVSTNLIYEKLIIVGYKNWKSSKSYYAVNCNNANDNVLVLDYLSTSDLAALYQNAVLFVYPSLYEGFGIPILEAFSSGCPVVASNVSSIPEVAGNAALYFDPTNSSEIAEVILKIIKDNKLRQSLVQRGYIRLKFFNWNIAAKQFMKIYEKILSGLS